jgi:cysteine desulfurase / selenocysteine lyase
LGNALQELNQLGIERVWDRVRQTSERIRETLRQTPGISLHDLGTSQSGLIAFNLAGWDAFELKRRLELKRINIGANDVAYTPLDMQARGLASIARISVSPLNTDQDIERLMAALRELRD